MANASLITAPELALRVHHPDAAAELAALGAPVVSADLDRIRVRQDYMSADIAAKFAIGFGLGSGSGELTSRAFALTYEAMIESAAKPQILDQEIWDEVYAIGVRVQIVVRESKSNVRLDAFSVAAAVQLGLAKADFETQIFPADAAALAQLVPASGTFNMGTFDDILTGIGRGKERPGRRRTGFGASALPSTSGVALQPGVGSGSSTIDHLRCS